MIEKLAFIAARAALAGIFLVSGWAKLGAPAGFAAYAAAFGLPFPTVAVLGAAALEIAAGLALLFGWRTTVAAGALALFSLVTAGIFHGNLGDENEAIHFWKNVAIAGGLAHLALSARPRAFGPAPEGKLGLA